MRQRLGMSAIARSALACNDAYTAMHTGGRTNDDIDAGGVLVDYAGIIVRDGYAGYQHFVDAVHAWCGAHSLRDLKGLHDADPAGQPGAQAMANTLVMALRETRYRAHRRRRGPARRPAEVAALAGGVGTVETCPQPTGEGGRSGCVAPPRCPRRPRSRRPRRRPRTPRSSRPRCAVRGIEIGQDAFHALLPRDHPLAGEPVLDVRDLADDPRLFCLGGCERQVRRVYRKAGVAPAPTHKLRELGTIISMVRAGVGVAVVPELTRPMLDADLVLVPLHQRVTWRLVLTGPADRPSHPAVDALLTSADKQP